MFLVGNGSERATLESLCQSLSLATTVTFLGERSDVQELLNVADAFVMTSRTEGLPMALIEAMAAGLPCVATAVGGIPSISSPSFSGLCSRPTIQLSTKDSQIADEHSNESADP